MDCRNAPVHMDCRIHIEGSFSPTLPAVSVLRKFSLRVILIGRRAAVSSVSRKSSKPTLPKTLLRSRRKLKLVVSNCDISQESATRHVVTPTLSFTHGDHFCEPLRSSVTSLLIRRETHATRVQMHNTTPVSKRITCHSFRLRRARAGRSNITPKKPKATAASRVG